MSNRPFNPNIAGDQLCQSCDTRNPNGARFCVICGNALPEAAAPAGMPAQPQRPTAPQPPALTPALAGAGTGGIVQHIYVNQAAPQLQVQQTSVNLLVRAIWFLLVGLWLGQVWLVIAWLFNLSVVGLPLGLWMLNRLPQVMTLRPQPLTLQVAQQGNSYTLQRAGGANFAVRAVYFVLIGWWVSLLWLQLAWLFAASLLGLPLAFLMFERTGAITTLGD